ncbi:MAG: hypothetical protein ACI8PG_005444 [Planctomycetota bacterium]
MDSIYWNLESIERMGNLPLNTAGTPRVIDSPHGKAVEFGGEADALFSQSNPLQGLAQFTLEILFCPAAGGLREQRFFHAGQVHGERVLFETRLTGDGYWYLDTFISSGESSCTLLNEGFLHPVDQWYYLAMSCDGQEQVNYVNGSQEQCAAVDFVEQGEGALSIGVRLNEVCWFKGAIAAVRLTPIALRVGQLL